MNRQSETFAREGIDLDTSTLADWIGACTANLAPLHALIRAHVMAADRLHGDDTTMPVQAKGRTTTGRLWAYVRDDRPFGGPAPPAALFYYSPDRRGEHPQEHLARYAGILQADAYAGFARCMLRLEGRGRSWRLVAGLTDGASCSNWPSWVARHWQQRLYSGSTPSSHFDAERTINGKSAEQRLTVRQDQMTPLVIELWMRDARVKMSRHAEVAKAMDYMLKRWSTFCRFLEDGRICLTNNAAERAWRSAARPGCLPAVTAAASAPRRCTP